ncbi:ATP-binding cassette sub-family D member 4 [Trichinella murrelli]|uniref:ATP-binding cassette sub-family D member 4 n=1 Tax=Trichinella murrelli TaxID=144512 RepID=A0A0V0U4W4_9BILA|nr:ATP-binding cassette sub-family D member 4 [Trichinella murrelli]
MLWPVVIEVASGLSGQDGSDRVDFLAVPTCKRLLRSIRPSNGNQSGRVSNFEKHQPHTYTVCVGLDNQPNEQMIAFVAPSSCMSSKNTTHSRAPVNEIRFNWLFVRRFFVLFKIMFTGVFSSTLALFIVLLGVIEQLLTYHIGILPSEFYEVLGGRDGDAFRMTSVKAICLILAKAFILTSVTYSTNVLYLHWRQRICHRIHLLYFNRFVYYEINHLQAYRDVDNPDQRITQDVEKTCRIFSDIFSKVIMSPFIIGYYTYKTGMSSGYIGPLSIFCYFIVATIINKFLMSPIVRLVAEQERKEGDFRFKHVSVRNHSEAIAFYQSGSLEKLFTEKDLENLLNTQQKLINWRFFLTYSNNSFDYFGAILSYLIIAIPILLLGTYDDVSPVAMSGIISRNSFYYMYLINSFSTLTDLTARVSDMAGTTHRVVQLYEYLLDLNSDYTDSAWSEEVCYGNDVFFPKKVENEKSQKSSKYLTNVNSTTNGMPILTLQNASLRLPNSTAYLIENLSLEVQIGRNVLITGDSSSGKSSLFRVFCGFWKLYDGSIVRHVPNRLPWVLYLPQKPYFPRASLRQQLVYPFRETYCSDSVQDSERLINMLRFLKLDHLVERCGGLDQVVDWDWNHVLTPGESQRLSILRIFYHRPAVAFMDEVTSAIGADYEKQVYETLRTEGVTVVSIGHRHSLRSFHQVELHLNGHGSYTLSAID